MRPGSAGRPVAITMATCVDSHMNSIDPRQMRMLVRKPAGLFFISRSTPMRPRQTIARSAFGRKSRASGSIEPQDSSTFVTRDRSLRPRRYNYILFQGDAMNEALGDLVATGKGTGIAQARTPRRRWGTASAIGLLATGALVGTAAYRIVLKAQPAPALAAAGSRDAGAPSADAGAPPGGAGGGLLAQAPQESFAAVAKAVMPSVVNIASLKVTRTYEYSPFMLDPFFRDFFG